jgi:hypothetical protein
VITAPGVVSVIKLTLRSCATGVYVDGMEIEDVMTPTDAAEQSGLPVRTVQYALMRGFLHGHQLSNGSWITSREAVEAWLKSRGEQR